MIAVFGLTSAMAQNTGTKTKADGYSLQDRLSTQQKETKTNFNQAKQLEGMLSALSGYGEGGTTVDIPFSLGLSNTDFEYGDSISITFPAGFTINSVSNDDIFGPSFDPDGDPETFNGIDGQTVTWGDNDNNFGGITATDPDNGPFYFFSINVTVDGSITGDQTIDYFVSGDGFGSNPGDLSGSVTISGGQSIAGIVATSPDHNTLETAVNAAGLTGALGTVEGLTLFAPTDGAFDALPDGVLDDLLADPTGALANVLLYHLLDSEVFSTDLSDGQMVTTVQGQDVTITIEGENVFVNDAQVILADLEATNGVVHVIDAVLVPEAETTIYDIVVNSDVHTTLETAIDAAGLDGALSNPDLDLTLFAPTDDAFDALPDGVLDDLLADPTGALANVLLYHVTVGSALSTDLMDGMEIVTAQGETVTVSINGGDVMINNAMVTTADIETANGVVHVIDAVLVPDFCTLYDGGPYTNFNTLFGGAPEPTDGICPYNVITTFEAFASEAYVIDNFVEGRTYTFSLSGGNVGAWDPYFMVISDATGELVATETEGFSITWTSPADGTYIIAIQEEGFCGASSPNLSTSNGFPGITCESDLTVVDIIVNSDVHNTLETAVIAAGLDDDLAGEGPFTVFAPTDDAFAALPAGTIEALLDDPTGALTQVLQHHVVGALAYSTDLSDGQMIETLLGDNVTVGVGDEITITSSSGNTATVTVADIVASNGVVHVIDAVLIPSVLGVEDLSSVSDFNLYPNPAENQFAVELQMTKSDHLTIDVVNIVGQVVKSFDFGTRSAGFNREVIDINDLSQGMYMINIRVGQDQATTKLQVTK